MSTTGNAGFDNVTSSRSIAIGYHAEVANDRLSYRIIGIAIDVHQHLGPDFAEAQYHDAFVHGLEEEGLTVESEKEVAVTYRQCQVGSRFIDLLVDDEVVIELKAVHCLNDDHFRQLGTNVRLLGRRRGLLINFGRSKIEVRRFANDHAVDGDE